MRESQIDCAKRDFERRSNDLKAATSRGDITAESIALGTIVVESR
jgi:hypothetical protein